jgi:hypothetical protein
MTDVAHSATLQCVRPQTDGRTNCEILVRATQRREPTYRERYRENTLRYSRQYCARWLVLRAVRSLASYLSIFTQSRADDRQRIYKTSNQHTSSPTRSRRMRIMLLLDVGSSGLCCAVLCCAPSDS